MLLRCAIDHIDKCYWASDKQDILSHSSLFTLNRKISAVYHFYILIYMKGLACIKT